MAFFIFYFCGMHPRFYSFIIPVYNRPEEIQELLQSFTSMEPVSDFEILIIEDGSNIPCKAIIENFNDKLPLRYFFKENSGPGDSRNFGMKQAKGDYFIIFDSDCLLPSHYLKIVDAFLTETPVDCFGGADAAHRNFTNVQKAINYVMTSFWTTGGLRGSDSKKFEPRSFNMGISKRAFERTQGFATIHPGEDPDLSQRIRKAGFKTAFIPNAYVYHKRRVSFEKFYTQVKKFGLVRPILNSWHPNTKRITFWFPSAFILFTLLSLAFGIFVNPLFLVPIGLYLLLLFLDATFQNRSVSVGVLVLPAVFVQFFGYGLAFLTSTYYISLLKRKPKQQFPQLFFEE